MSGFSSRAPLAGGQATLPALPQVLRLNTGLRLRPAGLFVGAPRVGCLGLRLDLHLRDRAGLGNRSGRAFEAVEAAEEPHRRRVATERADLSINDGTVNAAVAVEEVERAAG